MKVSTLLLCTLFTLSSAIDIPFINHNVTNSLTNDTVNALYESWLVKHGKTYKVLGEKEKRFRIFKDNLRFIDNHNSGDHSYKLGLNKFADLTNKEFRAMYTGLKMVDDRRKLSAVESDRYTFQAGDVLPESVDWRKRGIITFVKDQRTCGSGWAFSATGAVETIYAMAGVPTVFSEQELLDCAASSSEACNGGPMENAFEFIQTHHLYTGVEYIYIGEYNGKCMLPTIGPRPAIDGYGVVPDDKLSLQKAVANQPVSVSIDTSGLDLQLYTSGIINASCGTTLDHSVLVAGYGTKDGQDYRLLKNSWSVMWGEFGYFRISRSNGCGITKRASYPIKDFGT